MLARLTTVVGGLQGLEDTLRTRREVRRDQAASGLPKVVGERQDAGNLLTRMAILRLSAGFLRMTPKNLPATQ